MNNIMASSILKDLMQRRGISGKEMALKLNVRVETISRHVNGRTAISVVDAARYAEILDVKPEQILFPEHTIPILGEIGQQHVVKSYPIPKTLTGPAPYPSWVVGYQYARDLGWYSKRVILIDRKHMEEGRVSSLCRDQLSMVSIKKTGEIKLAVVNTDSASDAISGQPREFILRNPYSADLKHPNKLELNWASPIAAVIHIPSLFDCKIV